MFAMLIPVKYGIMVNTLPVNIIYNDLKQGTGLISLIGESQTLNI